MTDDNGAATANDTRGTIPTTPPQTEETPAIDLMLAQIGPVRDGVKQCLDDLGGL